jgi:hypothetical protein
MPKNSFTSNNTENNVPQKKVKYSTDESDIKQIYNNVSSSKNDNYNKLSQGQQMLRKLDMLRKLGEFIQQGVKLSKNYNIGSDYFAMKYEYQSHANIKSVI